MSDATDDRQQIVDIIATYCFAVDVRDIDVLMSLMTDDICYSWRGGKQVAGRAAVREYVLASWASLGPTLHSVSSPPLMSIEANEATSMHYGHAEHAIEETGVIKRSAMAYVNRYRRTGDRWRICQRRADTLYSSDAGKLTAGYRDRETSWQLETERFDSILMLGWRTVTGSTMDAAGGRS